MKKTYAVNGWVRKKITQIAPFQKVKAHLGEGPFEGFEQKHLAHFGGGKKPEGLLK